jgi:hypothetical protein
MNSILLHYFPDLDFLIANTADIVTLIFLGLIIVSANTQEGSGLRY